MSGAADDVALDHRDLRAEPSGVGGRGVARRPTADDHESSRHEAAGYRSGARGSPAPDQWTGRDQAASGTVNGLW